MLALTSRLFSLFEAWEWRPQNTNPAKGIERSREEARDRILSPTEIAALSAALNDAAERHPASVAAIRLAAVTGLRIGEVISIRWEHVSFESGRLTMPATKTGRRVHDLPTAALAILTELPRINAWAFTTGGEVPVTYRWVRKVFLTAAEAAGLQDVRLHDLRRTVMTTAAAAGLGTHVLRDLLGHKTTVMADRYIRAVGNPVRSARRAGRRCDGGDDGPQRWRRCELKLPRLWELCIVLELGQVLPLEAMQRKVNLHAPSRITLQLRIEPKSPA